MKKFTHLISLLPCQTLEDFPTRCSRDKAQSLLAAWTALWHPALITAAEKAPVWRPANNSASSDEEAEQFRDEFIHEHYYSDDGSEDHEQGSHFEFDAEVFAESWRGSCIVIPSLSQRQVYPGFAAAARELGASVISDFKSRSELLSQLSIESKIAPDLVNDFFALAYVRLQVELMTRQLRYSSDLDLERFGNSALDAANAAAASDEETARKHLQAGFDQLAEERNQYYPVDAELLDMVLLSDSIRPESIESELACPAPKSFVMTGSCLRSIADKSPQIVQGIADRIEEETLGLVAGPQHELPEDLLSLETSRHQLSQSVESFEDVLGQPPEIFMRRRAGLHASLPGLLIGCKFRAAIHATLDQGEIPEASATGIRWVGTEGSEVMALGKSPVDAASDKSFLDLAVRIGNDLDSAHVSTVLFARWPTQTCDSFQDLQNSTRYGNVLGDFVHAATWLENAYDPGYGDTWEADEYVAPWFGQAVDSASTRPISTFTRYWKHYYRLAAAQNLFSLLTLESIEVDPHMMQRISQIQNRIETETQDWNSDQDEGIETDLAKIESELTDKLPATFVNLLPWRRGDWLTFPSVGRDVAVSRVGSELKLLTQNASRCDVVTELSGFGQLLTHPTDAIENDSAETLSEKPVDDSESILRNEQFEVRLDRSSGGIKGVHFYGKRGNLLSQRIALRQFDQATRRVSYGKMVCDSFELIRHSNIASESRGAGQVVGDDGKMLARFVQKVSLQRGRNVIDVEVTLSDINFDRLSTENYFVNRIAWGDETAELFCDMQGARHAVRKPAIEATHFVEVANAEQRFALLTHGLPWHRRGSKTNLDTILIAGNEQQRTFRLGIAINPESTMQLAIAEMHPSPILESMILESNRDRAVSTQISRWMLHLANRNLVVTSTEPIFDADDQPIAIQLRLQETEGQSGALKLYCRRHVETAQKQSLDGELLRDITCREESSQQTPSFSVIETSFSAGEMFAVQLLWNDSTI